MEEFDLTVKNEEPLIHLVQVLRDFPLLTKLRIVVSSNSIDIALFEPIAERLEELEIRGKIKAFENGSILFPHMKKMFIDEI